MWYPPVTEVKAFPTAALSTSGIGNDDKIGKSGQREILAQMKFENSRNTGCISDFSNCTVGTKDLLSAEVDFISASLWVEGDSFLSACQNKLPCIFS